MKHLIFKNANSQEFGYTFEKVIISLDDLGIINPKDQFKGAVADSQGAMVADYNFYLPQIYNNIKSQNMSTVPQEDNFIRGIGIKARFDLSNIPFEKGEEPFLPTFGELLKEIYVNAITANPGGDGPRGTSRNVIEMPAPQVKDAISGRVYTGQWLIGLDEMSLDNVSVLTSQSNWKIITADCAEKGGADFS